MPIRLTRLEGSYCLYRFPPGTPLPRAVTDCPFYCITATAEELSIVAPDGLNLKAADSDPGWALLRVLGKLDPALVGVLAGLTGTLAGAGISVFAISTFDTDYLLVREAQARAARAALQAAGYRFNVSRGSRAASRPLTMTGLLKRQVPLVKSLLVDKIGTTVIATLKSDQAWEMALGGIYEFLPTPVRLMLPRDAFIPFFVRNRRLVLPESLRPSAAEASARPLSSVRSKLKTIPRRNP